MIELSKLTDGEMDILANAIRGHRAPPLLPITQVDPQWQQAMDDLTDEKASLALVLHDIVMEWESLERQGIYYGRLAAIMTRARFVLGNLDKVGV